MELFVGVITGLIILVFLVTVHELGHAIVARRNGVVVEEFGVGLPPRVWAKKLKSGLLFSVNWLPLGGFVKLQGEHDSAKKKGDYGAVTFFKKTKILLAGVAVNWLVAVLLLSVLALSGLPKVIPDQVSIPGDTTTISKPVEIVSITKNNPADRAGLKVGDGIVRFANQEVPTVDSLLKVIKSSKGKTVAVVYVRDRSERKTTVDLNNVRTGEVFGAGLGQREMIKATWSAPVLGIATATQYTWVTLQGVGNLIGSLTNGLVSQLSPDASVRKQAADELQTISDGVAGPIGIIGTIFPAAQHAGLTQLIFLTAIISLSLAVMNILPIPALDGGRWFVMALFRLFKKNLSQKREEKIQMIGFTVLIGLVVLVTIADVAKLF